MSLAHAISSFETFAVNFSRIVFPTLDCAEAEPIDDMANKVTPTLASKRIVNFIEYPLMIGSEPSSSPIRADDTG
jgi:hypothetical protein